MSLIKISVTPILMGKTVDAVGGVGAKLVTMFLATVSTANRTRAKMG